MEAGLLFPSQSNFWNFFTCIIYKALLFQTEGKHVYGVPSDIMRLISSGEIVQNCDSGFLCTGLPDTGPGGTLWDGRYIMYQYN